MRDSGSLLSYINVKTDTLYGVMCSDNINSLFNHVSRKDNSFVADCKTKGSENLLNAKRNKYQRVYCPPGCVDDLDARVYGRGPFALESSICRAGIYEGYVTDADGGFIVIAYDESNVSIEGYSKN